MMAKLAAIFFPDYTFTVNFFVTLKFAFLSILWNNVFDFVKLAREKHAKSSPLIECAVSF